MLQCLENNLKYAPAILDFCHLGEYCTEVCFCGRHIDKDTIFEKDHGSVRMHYFVEEMNSNAKDC